MPMAARYLDAVKTGHICAPVTFLNTPKQATVSMAGRLAARMFDFTFSHAFPPKPPCAPHIAFINKGWPNVFVVEKPQGFLGCSTDTPPGGMVASGSPNVYVGGKPESGAQAAADGSRNSLGQQVGGGAAQGFAPPG